MQGAGPDRPLSPRDRHLPLFPGAQDLVIRRLDRFCYSASRRFQRRRWRRKSQSKNKATTRMAMLSLCVTEYIEAGRRAFDSVPLPNFPPMVAVAVCFFVVGAVLGAWILHLLGPVVHTVHFYHPPGARFPSFIGPSPFPQLRLAPLRCRQPITPVRAFPPPGESSPPCISVATGASGHQEPVFICVR